MRCDIADLINESVTAYRVGEALGMDPDSSGRCACPVHGGRDRNMFLQRDGKWAHCYVCGVNCDSIRLVERVRGFTFKEAVAWLNSAFNLGLNIDQPMDKNAADALRIAKERREREREERQRRERDDLEAFLDADQLLSWAEGIAERYAPTVPGQKWDWRFTVALQKLSELREDREQYRLACWKTK